jgi:stage II sporulation protein E
MAGQASNAAYRRRGGKAEEKNSSQSIRERVLAAVTSMTLLLTAAGFLIGRVSLLNELSPFGIGFLVSVALLAGTQNTAIIGTGIILGLLTRTGTGHTIESILCIALIFVVIKIMKFDSRAPTIKGASMAFIVNLSVALVSGLITNGAFITYDVLMGIFDSTIVMALVYIYNYSLPVVMERKKRRMLSNEEVICLSITCAIIISGLSDIYIYGISLKIVFSIAVIIIAAYGQGAGVGAVIGTTIGLITCISSNQVPVIIGTYGFCGLLAGVFKDMGKLGAAAGFVIADIVMMLYLGGTETVVGVEELIGGVLMFMVIPVSLIDRIAPFIDTTARSFIEQQSYVERIKDMIRAKITRITDVFSELSKTLQESEGSDRLRQGSEVNTIINSVVDRVCPGCDARNICWSRDFYNTYQNMFEMIDVIQLDGRVELESVPADLKNKCLRISQLIKTSNYMFEMYRVNYKWRRKSQEGKRVVAEQLEGISGILKGLSEEIRQEINFKGDIEEELAVALDKEGLEFSDIVVVRDESGKYEVNMYKRACLGRRECIKDIGPVVSKVLKKRMKRDKASCMVKEGTNLCYFKLVEAVKFQISTGVARAVKDEGGLSGDNYSFIELNDGKYMMALSDGMGTGPSAAVESNSAITLLERYLEAGFDRSTALKAINSVMALKSPDETFATVDLAIADLYTGEAEFIKIGAASTYIKRVDGAIESISSTTLPIGILNSVDIESNIVQLHHGDMIIMITDGIQEAGTNSDWITSALEEIDSRNPQIVAEELLEKAKERNEGWIRDDMTVLVSKAWEVI